MTDSKIVKFSDEIVRPTSEMLRNIHYQLKSIGVDWQNTIGALIPNDAGDILEDNRPEISDLSGEDLHKFKDIMITLVALMETGDNLQVIQKACVRTMKVV